MKKSFMNFDNWKGFYFPGCNADKFPLPTDIGIVGLIARPTKFGSLVIVYDHSGSSYGFYGYCYNKNHLYKFLTSDMVKNSRAKKADLVNRQVDKLTPKSSVEDIYKVLALYLRTCCGSTTGNPTDRVKRFVHNLEEGLKVDKSSYNKRYRELFVDASLTDEPKRIQFTEEEYRDILKLVNKE